MKVLCSAKAASVVLFPDIVYTSKCRVGCVSVSHLVSGSIIAKFNSTMVFTSSICKGRSGRCIHQTGFITSLSKWLVIYKDTILNNRQY